jgi:hypothetical protein
MLATVRDVTVEQRLQPNGEALTATESKIANFVLPCLQVASDGLNGAR